MNLPKGFALAASAGNLGLSDDLLFAVASVRGRGKKTFLLMSTAVCKGETTNVILKSDTQSFHVSK